MKKKLHLRKYIHINIYKTRPYLYHTDTTSGKKESVFINLNTYIHLIKPYLQLKTQNLFH